MRVLILILFCTSLISCQSPAPTPRWKQLGLPERTDRPKALENGKFFEQSGQKMLYGGTNARQHFKVDNLELKPAQFHYGIGREAFPALLQPFYHTVNSADAIHKDDDRFLVAHLNGEAKAYAISDLMRHEIVNDTLAGRPIMAAYCILADLGAVYDRAYGPDTLTFALSGYTYYDPKVWNGMDGFVFWDRETESLWWPLTGRSVSGPLRGVGLQVMDEAHWEDTTWSAVKQRFPQAKVMRSGLDFNRPDKWKKAVNPKRLRTNFSSSDKH
jgi:hypothetical protein